MIIGYQIEDKHGRNWHDNIDRADNPRTVLSEKSAIEELKRQQKMHPERGFRMIAVLEGDIEGPFLECSLTAAKDQYKALAVSVSHIPLDEHEALERLSVDPFCNMITGRDTGWFIKLYDEPNYNLGYDGLGEEFHNILVSALKAGYQMVEIDADAQVYDEFPVFE